MLLILTKHVRNFVVTLNQTAGENPAETTDSVEVDHHRITANDSWMPRSGNGPYSTIPISSGIDDKMLGQCGVASFMDTRRNIKLLASEYAARAVALVAIAKTERAALARELCDVYPVIRPHRIRLCLELDEARGFLYLCWRVVVKRRWRYVRERVLQWNCQSDLPFLVAGTHPAEELLIRRIEVQAVQIRLRWFALVRQVYYMNVTEDFRLADLEAGRIQAPRGLSSRLMRRLGGAFSTRRPKS